MAPFEKEENKRIDMCSSNPDLERICTLGGGGRTYSQSDFCTILYFGSTVHYLSKGEDAVVLAQASYKCGEGAHPVREKFCERSGGKYFFPSPRGRAREGVKLC